MEQILEGDSLYLHSYCTYDDNDRLIQLKNYGINGDSLLIHTFYNKKGGVKKRLLYNNQDGRTVTITDFNAAGKATKTKKVYSQFADFATLEYSAGKSNYKHSTPVIEKPPKTAIKNMYSYYANGLSYEKVFFINQKPVSVEKTFYTYYQAGMANTPTAIQPESY